MDKFKKIFSSIDKNWLIKQYLFSFAVWIFMVYSTYDPNTDITGHIVISALMFIVAIFYPFAMYVYTSIVNFIIGDKAAILIPLYIYIPWKIIRFAFIWIFSVPIGILGLIYLFIKTNLKKNKN